MNGVITSGLILIALAAALLAGSAAKNTMGAPSISAPIITECPDPICQ